MSLELILDAILEQPDNDTPRLAFADECESLGDTDRAEYIRLAIEEAAANDATLRRVRRMVDLAGNRCNQWFSGAGTILTTTGFLYADAVGKNFSLKLRRGWPEMFSGSWASWVGHTHILDRFPITHVYLETWPDHRFDVGNWATFVTPDGVDASRWPRRFWNIPAGEDFNHSRRGIVEYMFRKEWPRVQSLVLPPASQPFLM